MMVRPSGAAVMILTSWMVDLAFFAMLAVLVSRDRAVVVRELSGEVGVRTGLLLPAELAMVSSYTTLGSRNLAALLSHGWAVFSARRSKQLALVELAFVKMRRRRGESGRELDVREARLRQTIAQLTARGVRLD